MKRTLPSVQLSDRAYAQQPVSCQFCRSRKLKCDRGRPSCFNCNSRGYDCIYEADQRQSSIPAAKSTTPDSAQPSDYRLHTTYDNSDLARRVEKLEQAVFARGEPDVKQDKAFDSATSPRRKIPISRLANHDEEQQKTSQWLEGLLTTNATGGSPAASSAKLELSPIMRDFPTYNDASELLNQYIKTVDATYRILHNPTAWNLLRELYMDLGADRTPSATRLSFFLCIFAGSAYVSKTKFQFKTFSLQGHSQIALAELWARQAVSLVTEPPVPPSVEALQTVVSLAHLCTQIEGVSGNMGLLVASGTRMAKAMKIHRLDSQPLRDERCKNGADMVDIEIKRRIWWHMVASDWLLSFVGGPNEGTYMLHPRQMETFHPSNVEDVDIPIGITHLTEESYNLPLSSPTTMSYFLYRIKYATLVREVVDSLPPSFFSSPGSASCDEVYGSITALNEKYQHFIKSLPPFFQLTIDDTESHEALLRERPYLEWQRYLINFVLHNQLARLHRPFLIRGSRQRKYEHSRFQCIRSAETVIEIRDRIMGDQGIGSFTYVLQHFLTAAIILAMDVCYNADKVRAPHRKQKVLRACRDLEEELNTKLVPSNGEANEDMSAGQIMIQSFQNAVRNLRATLRKNVREDESDSTTAEVVKDNVVLADTQRRIATRASKSEHNLSKSNMTPSAQSINASNANPGQNEVLPGQYQQTSNAVGIVEEANRTDVSGELMVDELWDEVFTFGSTFNDTDWDAFFSDFGANMG